MYINASATVRVSLLIFFFSFFFFVISSDAQRVGFRPHTRVAVIRKYQFDHVRIKWRIGKRIKQKFNTVQARDPRAIAHARHAGTVRNHKHKIIHKIGLVVLFFFFSLCFHPRSRAKKILRTQAGQREQKTRRIVAAHFPRVSILNRSDGIAAARSREFRAVPNESEIVVFCSYTLLEEHVRAPFVGTPEGSPNAVLMWLKTVQLCKVRD